MYSGQSYFYMIYVPYRLLYKILLGDLRFLSGSSSVHLLLMCSRQRENMNRKTFYCTFISTVTVFFSFIKSNIWPGRFSDIYALMGLPWQFLLHYYFINRGSVYKNAIKSSERLWLFYAMIEIILLHWQAPDRVSFCSMHQPVKTVQGFIIKLRRAEIQKNVCWSATAWPD